MFAIAGADMYIAGAGDTGPYGYHLRTETQNGVDRKVVLQIAPG